MAEDSQKVNLKESFVHWLSERISTKMLSDIYILFDDIERFCIERDILQQPLFETVSLPMLQKVQDTINQNREFRSSYRGQLAKMSSAIHYYMEYVSEYAPQSKSAHSIHTPVVSAAVPESNRVAFISWLKGQGEKASNIFPCLFSIRQTSNYAVENKLSNQDLFAIHSPETIENLITLLLENSTFKLRNNQQHQRPLEALKKYLRFCQTHCTDADMETFEPESTSVIVENNVNVQKTDPFPPLESAGFSDASQQEREKTIEQRYNAILQSDFPDGLRPIALRLRKFKGAYAQRYGEELPVANEELHKQLRNIGTVIGDRIYAKKSIGDAGVMKELLSAVDTAFANGATCVYLEPVLSRYGTELANELNIYSMESLKSLLTQNLKPIYRITSEYISQRELPADTASDVQNALKESLQPLNYAELQKRLWYVPLEKIKFLLVKIPSVANVDLETYFYAPNLPVTAEEMNIITAAMRKEIDQRGFLVAKDIPELMKQYCPSAAMNTADFKDWGLRNIFRILLNDQFSFSGSIICSKGQYMDMERVFRNFCAERERLTIDELKEFSNEVGTQIYWESVMHEMIRISQREMIRQDAIHFNTKAVDAVLEHLCPGNFIPVHEIDLFMQFPVAEVPWNGYVLESYLLNCSEKFVLWQASISASGYYGVMARADAPYSSYRDVITDVLAHSDHWKDEKTALELLVKTGCQARRRMENFGEILKEARVRREKLSDTK